MAVQSFLGTWEVSKFLYENEMADKDLEGFHLDEMGNVDWTVRKDLAGVPLFCCDTYEICTTKAYIGVHTRIRFGTFAGHVIEFRCYYNRWNKDDTLDQIVMFCKGWCHMQCNRVDSPKVSRPDTLFSFLPALDEGFFHDARLVAANCRAFRAHRVILRLLAPAVNWADHDTLRLLPENVLATILHYLYAECLPESMDDDTADRVIQAVAQYECFSRLSDLCRVFKSKNVLKKQLVELVQDMHASINKVIDYVINFNSTWMNDASNGQSWKQGSPQYLCFIIKQSLRDTAVVGAKFLLLCDVFSKRRQELTRVDHQEIIVYANSRVPIFVKQVLNFFQAIKHTFSAMTSMQRQEVTTFLVPEIDVIFETLTNLVHDINDAMQLLLAAISPHDVGGSGGEAARSLCIFLHSREVMKCRTIQEIVSGTLETLNNKKENFNEMTANQKVRTVTRNFDQFIEELTFFLIQLESALDDKLELSEFKFCFKVGISKVAGVLDVLVQHRDLLQSVLRQLTQLVQREAFTQTMQALNLTLDSSRIAPTSTQGGSEKEKSTASECIKSEERQHNNDALFASTNSMSPQLNLVSAFCVSPRAKDSTLAKQALQLLRSEQDTDVVFEVLAGNAHEDADAGEESVHLMKAHRVILASRCDWFRRALQSGMRESIDRKIVVHDTSPFLFRVFLEYLYCGQIEQSLSSDQYSELLMLSDRYEVDSLKQLCECTLKLSIDAETVLYYLSMADQFNARLLRDDCISFVTRNCELTENELFYELPIALQAEIFDAIWAEPKSSWKVCCAASITGGNVDAPKGEIASQEAAGDVSEELPSPDADRVHACLSQMRDILGDAAPQDSLIQIILAADFDLCRAINYFYTRDLNNGGE